MSRSERVSVVDGTELDGRSVTLPDVSREVSVKVTVDIPSLSVGVNVGITYPEQCPIITRQDVTQSLNFATRAADKKADKSKQPVEWTNAYRGTLRALGWALTKTDEAQISDFSDDNSVDELILRQLKQHFSDKDYKTLETSLAALREPQNAKVLALMNGKGQVTSTTSGGAGFHTFQVGACNWSASGGTSLNLASFALESSKASAEQLYFGSTNFQSISQSIKADRVMETMTLDEQNYADVRELVRKKLKENSAQFLDLAL